MRSLIFGLVLGVVLIATAPLQAADPEPQDTAVQGIPDAEVPLKPLPAKPAPARSLDPILAPLTNDRLFRDAEVAMQVVSLRTGDEVFGYQADMGMVPASTMKILTAAAALKTLGPSYRFVTRVLTDGKLRPDGVLDGNLYIRGGGDPTFVVEKLWKLVLDLRLNGVLRIEGNVYFDDSWYDRNWATPGWNKARDIAEGPSYFAQTGALALNFDTVAVVVRPGAVAGAPAVVVLETVAPGVVTLDNRLVTTSGGRRRVEVQRVVTGRTMSLSLTGTVPLSATAVRYYRTVPDPTAYFTAAFAAQLRAQGISVGGSYLDGIAPSGSKELLSLKSPPLASILMDMNKYSSNFIAEQVVKALGAEVAGAPGTTASGIAVIEDYLASLGIPREEFKLVNGSGLTRNARIRPTHLTAVLADMAGDPRVGHEFMASLAIGGRDGTLWARFTEDDQIDRVRGKTGTLDGVHCLAGTVEAADGEIYAFAYLVNELPGSIARARAVADQFCGTLCQLDGTVQVGTAPTQGVR
jgi:D-alanyl-D-alanine carboxypeptidase/D-alanyl-D-alanine-endopeptidase (penicillin-binding protein 4)